MRPQRGTSPLDIHIHNLEYRLHVQHRDDFNQPDLWSALGVALLSRFDAQGMMTDLEEAIAALREELLLRPISHPDRSTSLWALGMSLLDLFTMHSRGTLGGPDP